MIRFILISLIFCVGTPAMTAPLQTTVRPPLAPVIIAHRGASGDRPEHTRIAYELAIAQGADVIEPDLVMSRDGHLVVRHENEIGETTDVAQRPEFADRRITRTVDGRPITGWFAEDFTLAELKTLRARERLPALRPGSAAFDGREPILTFDDVIQIAQAASERTGRIIGLSPELKHPSHFAALGLDMEEAFIAALERHGLTGADAPILIQCFEVGALQRLAARIDAPLLQLISAVGGPTDRPDLTYADMVRPSGLAAVAAYAAAIGAQDTLIVPRDADGRGQTPTSLISDAHEAGLKVAVWSLRAENLFLPLEHRRGDDAAEHGDLTTYARRFRALGADAIFTDFPGLIAETP